MTVYVGRDTCRMAEDGLSAHDVMHYTWDEIEKPVRFAFDAARLVGWLVSQRCMFWLH